MFFAYFRVRDTGERLGELSKQMHMHIRYCFRKGSAFRHLPTASDIYCQ